MYSSEMNDQAGSVPEFANDDSICLFPAVGIDESEVPQPFAVDVNTQEVESNPVIGSDVSWRTLISSDRVPSSDFILGIAEVRAGGILPLHRHQPAEFYLGLSGSGVVTVAGIEYPLSAGISIFIPGDIEHAVFAGDEGLSFAYGFARADFSEISYEVSADEWQHG